MNRSIQVMVLGALGVIVTMGAIPAQAQYPAPCYQPAPVVVYSLPSPVYTTPRVNYFAGASYSFYQPTYLVPSNSSYQPTYQVPSYYAPAVVAPQYGTRYVNP